VVVLFAETKIRSDHLSTHKNAFGNLRSLLKSEQSSLYAPFVNLDVSFDSSIANVAYSAQISGQVIYVGKGSVLLQDIKKRVPSAKLTIAHLQDLKKSLIDSNAYANGVTDLVVVLLDSNAHNLDSKYQESDTTIKNVHALVSSFTSKYVCAYIGREYDRPQFTTKFSSGSPRSQHEKRFILQTPANNNTNTSTPNTFRLYFGGWFWELFLVCIILIPLFVIGVYAIDGIQTPIFKDVKPGLKKK